MSVKRRYNNSVWGRKTLKVEYHFPPPPLHQFYITLADRKHLDQLTDPVSTFANREILEDHQLAFKRKKVFGHALLSSPFISHLEGTVAATAVLALPDPVRSFFSFSFCFVLCFCSEIPFSLLEDYFLGLLLLLLLLPCFDCCCCCCRQRCSSSREEGESKSDLGEMPSLRLKQRVLEAQAKVFRRRNSTSVQQQPPPDRSSSISSTSSNLVDIKNGNTSTSTSLGTTCPRGRSSGSASDSRNGSAIIPGAPKPTSPAQHPTPCPPLPPSPSEPPFTSISRESGDLSKLLTSEKPSVALVVPPVSTPVVDSASSPVQPPSPPKEKTRAAHPEFQQPLPSSSPQILQTTYPRLPSQILRKQSLLPQTESVLIQHLLDSGDTNTNTNTITTFAKEQPVDFHSIPVGFPLLPTPATLGSGMLSRKVWVKRPGGSPTTVNVREDDMVDDVRDVVLKRYQNALGRSYDAPDITLRIIPRPNRPRSLEHSQGHHNYSRDPAERMLNPDENLMRTLDEYFPGGQTIDEALVIDVPQHPLRKTPRPSPHTYGYGTTHDSHLSIENGEYFPPMPAVPVHTQSQQMSTSMVASQPSISVLTTGQVPPIPGSPGGSVARNPRITRPNKTNRMQTSSTAIYSSGAGVTTGGTAIPLPRQQNRSRGNSDAALSGQPPPALPTPAPPVEDVPQKVQTPPVRVASPVAKGFKKDKKQHASPAGLLPDGAVPPINVLIVEDNVINLRLLEAFMKRLKVRWQSAINGKEAVDKWRAGGFHLVLMDIQLPVMNGLEATKEIRRLERINSIGFQEPPLPGNEVLSDQDKLPNSILFKSPVIIVALTASSLQSDRHEALAAGCNDFLTKVSRSFALHAEYFGLYANNLLRSL